MPVDVIVGLQWGDEGKGKIVDILSPKYSVIARYQGGPNAGHTLVINGKKFVFHTLPSGVINNECFNILGSGMVIDPLTLQQEIEKLESNEIFPRNRILVSRNAHLILPSHKLLDAYYEGLDVENKIGSTLKGIGPTYQDKVGRRGIMIKDIFKDNFKDKYTHLKSFHFDLIKDKSVQLSDEDEMKWFDAIKYLKQLEITDTELYINEKLKKGENILAEGAQGALLDINFGTYPYVTSSNTISSACCTGLGVSPKYIRHIYGIFKAYTTRVGEGPFLTEQTNEAGELLMKNGFEYGSTTGRPRRCGWLDLVALRYSIMLNGADKLIITKSDVLNCLKEIKVCNEYLNRDKTSVDFSALDENPDTTPSYKSFPSWQDQLTEVKSYDELPESAKRYFEFIEKELECKIDMISVGPDRTQTIFR
jgi:adenylosuccinate synthase